MKNKKEEPKGIKFNFYWIYAIIAVLFFGIQILNVNTTSETSWQEFNRKMLQSKEVKKIVVVNRDIAQIYIKKEFLKRDKYEDVSKKSFSVSLRLEINSQAVVESGTALALLFLVSFEERIQV